MYDVLLNLTAHIVVVNHAERQRKKVGSYRVVAVERAVGIEHKARHLSRVAVYGEELLVESILHARCLCAELSCVGRFVKNRGKSLHHLVQSVIVGRSNESAVGYALGVTAVYQLYVLRRHAPVAVFVARHQSVLAVLILHVAEPALHVAVVVAHRFGVAILVIHHLEREGQGRRPCYVVRIIVPVGRSHVGYAAVFTLSLGYVACPLGIESVVVEYESLAEASANTVAKPRLTLVALRTVDGHALIVAQDAPHGVIVNLVEYGVGTFK